MAIAFLSLGSNLGRRRDYLQQALRLINSIESCRILKVSPIIETSPIGGPCGQRKFLNCAVKIETFLSCHKLLSALKKIERKLGRKRTVRWGPRTIDLDILLYGGQFWDEDKIQIPHPRICERNFLSKLIVGLI